MSMDYIRKTYGLTVKVGDRVAYTGGTKPLYGTVCGARGAYLRVRADGQKRSWLFHPGWELAALPRAALAGTPGAQGEQGEQR